MTLFVGQDVALTISTLDEAGNAANPASVQFKVKSPTGTVTTYVVGTDAEATIVAVGASYRLVFDAGEPGAWHVRSETLDADSNVIGVDEVTIIIAQSAVI